MIWTPTPDPEIGTLRVVRRFAFLPVTLVNGDRLWMQRYYALQTWTNVQDECGSWEAWATIARTSVRFKIASPLGGTA